MKKKINYTLLWLAVATAGLVLACSGPRDQTQEKLYTIDVASYPEKEILEGHLNLGGSNPAGDSIAFNSYYMSRNGKPFIPIMGEFHFSRYPNRYWEEEIQKIKVGGINTIATYVFWNLHEEKEGVFDWSGDKDVRRFIELCAHNGMDVIVRIGPFCHGEIRNGGFPDWLYGQPLQVRTNDPLYLKYVDRLYENIAGQLKGLYFKDGGPIMGIQIENELQHSAAPWGVAVYNGQPKENTVANYDEEITQVGVSVQEKKTSYAEKGVEHLRTLKDMAIAKGMVTPLYTATGWGNAAILEDEVIPVTAAYSYPFWTKEVELSPFYLFKDIQKNPDYSPVRYDGDRYPSFCAEMGAAIQMIYSRRPVVPAESAEGLILRSIGSGANGIGYYMYHGGTTPRSSGGQYMSDEPMGVSKISYDFQAPVGEYGLTKDSYRTLRVIHEFTDEFAPKLAPMRVVLPDCTDTISPSNLGTLRYAVREKQGEGFVFLVNFQDHQKRSDQKGLALDILLKEEKLRIPAQGTFTLPQDVCAILPFNLEMDGIRLKYSTAQLLSKVEDGGVPHYFFFAHPGMDVEYAFENENLDLVYSRLGRSVKAGDFIKAMVSEPGLGSTMEVVGTNGKMIYITTLTREQGLDFQKINIKGKDYALIAPHDVLLNRNADVTLISRVKEGQLNEFSFALCPAHRRELQAAIGNVKENVTGHFQEFTVALAQDSIPLNITYESDRRFGLTLDEKYFDGLDDIVLEINYLGDTGMVFHDGVMLNDHFYHGKPWLIGLKRYSKELSGSGLYFYLKPLYKEATFLVDLPSDKVPDFGENRQYFRLDGVKLHPRYSFSFSLEK